MGFEFLFILSFGLSEKSLIDDSLWTIQRLGTGAIRAPPGRGADRRPAQKLLRLLELEPQVLGHV